MATADLITQILNYVLWIIPLILVGALLIIVMRNKRFPLQMIILERRGENLVVTNDWGGRYKDKYSGLNGYTLLKAKDKVPVVNYDWIIHTNIQTRSFIGAMANKLMPLQGTVFLYRYGSKQYKPLKVSENKDAKKQYKEIVGNDGKPILIEMYQQFDPRGYLHGVNFEVMDWDDFNFMVQEFKASYERRKTQKQFWKEIVIPAMIIGGAVVVSIVMIKYASDFSAILSKNVPSSTPQNTTTTSGANIPVVSNLLSQ